MKKLIHINRISPKLCRLMARRRHGRKAMSHADIAFVSGLARSTVARISMMDNWNSLTLETIIRFSTACGVNLASPWPAIRAFKRCKGDYMKRCTGPQKRLYARLLKVEKKTGPTDVAKGNLPTRS